MPQPPTFGASLRDRWLLDPAVTYLNHGTVGAPPRAVLAHQRAIQDEIERQPARFLLRELADAHAEGLGRTPRMREAAAAVAEFVGLTADDELVFVDNITAGANAVLRSFPFQPDDEIARHVARLRRDRQRRHVRRPRSWLRAAHARDAAARRRSPNSSSTRSSPDSRPTREC